MRPLLPHLCVLAYVFCMGTGYGTAEDWPQLQHDPGHTGYTPDQPEAPYSLKWTRDLGEPMQTASQPIAAEGKVFVGTGRGNFHALDRDTGRTLWTYPTDAPIFGSPAYKDGIVYICSLDHYCHAVRSEDGHGLWIFETGEPIWASPVIAEDKVFVAGRDGFVYALDPGNGSLLWSAEVGGPVLCTPAYEGGVLYVGAGDMYVYAFDSANGHQIWKSHKIPGAAMREYWLVAHKGTLIVTTQLVYACHPTQEMIQKAVMNPFNEAHADDPVLVEDEVFPQLVKWYGDHPHHKTFHVLDGKTGKEKFIAPVIGVNGGSCTTPPPAVSPDGWAYMVYANIWLRASGWAFFGRLNLDSGEMEPLIRDRYAPKFANPDQWHWQPKAGTSFGKRSTWDGGFSVSDQSWGVSIGGEVAFPVRDPGWYGNPPFHNTFNVRTREDRYLIPGFSERRMLGDINKGTFGSGFHSTCSPVIISGKYIFHKSSRSVIFAFEGS